MKAQNQTGFTPATREKKNFSMAITAPSTQQMITRALKDDRMAARFTSTLIGAVSASDALKKCDPGTIIAAGLRGEGMGLIYGHGYYIVPYDTVAQFSLGYKGYCQLAMSTGKYADVNCLEVREGELGKIDPNTGEFITRDSRTGKPIINLAKYKTDEERENQKIIGYYAYYELKDGTFRFVYWSMDKLLRHADRYSPAFKLEKYNAMIAGELSADEQKKLLRGTPWYDVGGGQDKMCRKTVLRQLLGDGLAPLSGEVRYYINEDSDDGVIPDVAIGSQEPVVPTTGYVVDESTGEVQTKTAESAPVEPPVAPAMHEQGNDDTPKTTKRTERPAKAETAARDYSAGFFGEGEQ